MPPKRRRPTQNSAQASETSAENPPESPENNEPVEDCLVCTEAFQEARVLRCNHAIHLRCIALSGDARCPVCRIDVSETIEEHPELRAILQQRQQQIQQEREQQQTQESVQLARQLQHEPEPEERRRIHGRMMRFHGRIFAVRLEESEEPLDAGDCMLGVNQIMYNIHNQIREFSVDSRVLQLYQIIHELNEVSAETGLNISQLCNIIENTQ